MSKTLMIIDGHAQIFRAYHAPFRDLTSPDGEPTRATYVFCSMLLKLLKKKQPDYIAMAVDGPRRELKRTEFYPEYKAHRPPLPEDFLPQEKRILSIVEALGVPILLTPGYEADDMMATLAERFAGDDLDVLLVSRDKDLDQVVSEHVALYDPMKDETFDPAAIEAKKGYPPSLAIEVQTLMGDSADNIPGIAGVGPKTAVKLVMKYGSADAVLAAADEQTPKLRERLLAGGEAVALSRRLVTLDRDIPVDVTLDELAADAMDFDALTPIFCELGMTRLIDQIPGASPQADVPEAEATTAEAYTYHLVDTPEKLDALAEKLQGVKRLAVDTETTSTKAMDCTLVGVSLCITPGEAYYLPILGPATQQLSLFDQPKPFILDPEHVRRVIAPLLADESVTKVGQNFKYDRIVLARNGYTINGPVFDTMIAAHLLDATRRSVGMDALALSELNHRCVPFSAVCGKGKDQITFEKVPLEAAAQYAAEDADVTLRLADVFEPKLQAWPEVYTLFTDMEIPLSAVLAKMEMAGIAVDAQRLQAMETTMTAKADALRSQIIDHAGREFNVDSPKQLQVVLFEEQELPIVKKTKTGASTDSSVLEELSAETDNPIPPLLLEYRKLTKLIGTYLKGLAKCVHPETHRVHTSFNQTQVETGRLSSSDPNLQNIPIRSEEGRQIRSAFIAAEGHSLLGADYSQVELRMLAHFCRDETLLAAFADDQDIHRTVAAEVFHVPLEEVTSEQRSVAKTVNFGIVYGQTAFGLARTLHISRTEAADFIKGYNARFPQIQEYLQTCVAEAKSQGFVTTLFGRRRNIPFLDSSNPQQRAAGERLAINSVVQGSAADLIKQAMLNIDARITAENRPATMLLQIHDELVFEIPNDAIAAEQAMIEEEMTTAVELAVPLKVDVGIGSNWMDAK